MTRMMRIVVVLMKPPAYSQTAGLPLAGSAKQRVPRMGTL